MNWFARKSPTLGVVVLALTALYPVLVYFGLGWFSPTVVLLVLLALLAFRLVLRGGANGRGGMGVAPIIFVIVCTTVIAIMDDLLAVKFYPVLVSTSLAFVFGASLFGRQSIIEKIARVGEPDLPPHAVVYTRNVTRLWLCFFIVNGSISAWTATHGDMALWTLYNGLISYLLIGMLMGGEFLVRKYVHKRRSEAPSVAPSP
jgi:uncharacterized membrane protein